MNPANQGQAAAPPADHQQVQVQPTHTVIVNGVELTVLQNQLNEAKVKHEPLLKKTDRSAMSKNKWVALRSQIETWLTKKYSEVSLSETDLSVLSDTYELVQQNKLVRQHLEKWDMDDVFTLVLGVAPNVNGDLEAVTKSLLD
jgi:hypothetical protein